MTIEMDDRGHIKRYSLTDITEHLSKIHGERYKKYREEWDMAGKGFYIPEKPLYFFIEITSHCNMSCKMCYHSIKKNKGKIYNMPIKTIEILANQCKEMNVPSMILSSGSECLTHPEIKTIIKIFKKIGIIDFFLITNGLMLTEDIINLLIDCQIERLQISLDAATEETYKKIRGGNLNIIERNIYNFLKIKKERKSILPFLRLSFVKMNENINEINQFFEKWHNHADIIDFQDYVDFSYVDKLRIIETEPFICPDPFQRIGISCDGSIYPCCTFYQKYFTLGNIKEITLLEAWNSKQMSDLRNSIIRNQPHLACKNCYGSLKFKNINLSQ